MTFASETVDNRAWHRTLFLEIAGVETLLTERTIRQSSLTTPAQIPCIAPGGVRFGEARLDLVSLRQVGSTLELELFDVDGRLQSLFAVRTRRKAWVTSSSVTTAQTTINVSSTSALPTTGTVYINGETITYSGKTSTSITGCTRGAFGSKAQKHYGSTIAGPDVYLVPSVWRGRKAFLKAAYINASGFYGTAATDVETLLTLRFVGPPQYIGQGKWRLSLEELGASFAETQIYFGQRPLKAPTWGWAFAGTPVGDDLQPLFGTDTIERLLLKKASGANAEETYALVTTNVRTTLHRITDYPNIKLSWSEALAMPASIWNTAPADATYGVIGSPQGVKEIQHVCVFNGVPARIVLKLLLSKLGDGTNHATYDVLPGLERTEFGEESWRMGAGFDAASVDVDAFEAFLSSQKAWSFLLKDAMSVGDLLEEFCRTEGCYWFVNNAGKLTVRRLTEMNSASSSSTVNLIDDSLIELTRDTALEVEQQRMANSYLVRANYDPFTDEFYFRQLVVDWAMVDQFSDASEVIQWDSKFLFVASQGSMATKEANANFGGFAAMPAELLQRIARRLQKATTRPRVYLTARVAWSKALLNIGDVVSVTDSRLPSLNASTGASPTFATQPCLIIGKEYDAESPTVTFRMMMLDPGYFFAPFGKVASYNSTTKTITLSTTDAAYGSTSPGDHFAAGWPVYLFDVSTTPNAVDINIVASCTSSTITLTNAPAFTPASGDILVPGPTNVAGIVASAAGFKPIDFTWQIDNVETEIITGYPVSRWS